MDFVHFLAKFYAIIWNTRAKLVVFKFKFKGKKKWRTICLFSEKRNYDFKNIRNPFYKWHFQWRKKYNFIISVGAIIFGFHIEIQGNSNTNFQLVKFFGFIIKIEVSVINEIHSFWFYENVLLRSEQRHTIVKRVSVVHCHWIFRWFFICHKCWNEISNGSKKIANIFNVI